MCSLFFCQTFSLVRGRNIFFRQKRNRQEIFSLNSRDVDVCQWLFAQLNKVRVLSNLEREVRIRVFVVLRRTRPNIWKFQQVLCSLETSISLLLNGEIPAVSFSNGEIVSYFEIDKCYCFIIRRSSYYLQYVQKRRSKDFVCLKFRNVLSGGAKYVFFLLFMVWLKSKRLNGHSVLNTLFLLECFQRGVFGDLTCMYEPASSLLVYRSSFIAAVCA